MPYCEGSWYITVRYTFPDGQTLTQSNTYPGFEGDVFTIGIVNLSACPNGQAKQVFRNGVALGAGDTCAENDEQIISAVFTKTDPNCVSTPPDDPHDCINGQCVKASVYGTPGVHDNLAACQSVCGVGSNCNGVCLETAEYNGLTAKLNQIKAGLQ